jgi:hypothetical protein
MAGRKFSPVTPLSKFWTEISVSKGTGNKIKESDPDFPRDELVQVGANRLGITDRGKARYQRVLMQRAKQPRPISKNLDSKAAAARSVEVRKAAARARAEAA